MKKLKNLFFLSLVMAATLISCSKDQDPVIPEETFNAENLKGEWIVKTTSENYKKVTIASDGSFNVDEVTQAWNVASTNNYGKWTVDETTKMLTGTYEEVIGGVSRAKIVSLSVQNQQDNSFEAKATGEDASGNYKRLLGEVKLTRGQSTVPSCLPELRVKYEKTQKTVSVFETKEQTITWEESAVLTSTNPAIATVDSQSGLITAQNETGIAFIDIATSQGTSTIKVIVDNGYESFIGKTRAEIHDAYGTGNIAIENISQIMYNYNSGDFKFLKFEFREGKVLDVALYFKDNVNMDKYKNFLDEAYNFYKLENGTYAYINGETKETSTVGITFRAEDIKVITFNSLPHTSKLFHDYSIALGKTKEEIYGLYSSRTEVTTETLIHYELPSGYNDVVNEIFLHMEDNKCNSVLVKLQPSAQENKIVDHLSQEMKYEGMSSSGDYLFISNDASVQAGYFVQDHEISYKFNDLWSDFTILFGQSDMDIFNYMYDVEDYKYTMTDYSYSETGSDYYSPRLINDYTYSVGFVYNDDMKMCEYWVYLNIGYNANTIKTFLDRNYTMSSEESTNRQLIYYNTSKTTKVIFDISGYVAYVGLQEKRHTEPSFQSKGVKKIVKQNFSK